MNIIQRMALLEKKMNNRSPKPAKRLQHSLAQLQWNFLFNSLDTKDRNAIVLRRQPLINHRP